MNRSIAVARYAFVASLLLLGGCPGGNGGGGGGTPTSTYTLGGTVAGLAGSGLVLQNNGGDNLAVSANGNFTFTTGLPDGAGYAMTVLTQPGSPTQTCNVLRNGSGTVSAANVTDVVVDCNAPRFAYVANKSSSGFDSVSMYRVDAATGRLRNLGYVAGGASPGSVIVDPTGKYAYVVSHGEVEDSIYQYTIAANGLLVPMAPASIVLTGTSSVSVAIDPSGRYVYVANSSGNSISQYTIGASGGLTPMATATVAAGTTPYSISVDPSGRYAYVANFNSNNVSQYTIGASGGLTPMATATVAAGSTPKCVTVDPTGRYVYVANADNNGSQYSVSQYTIGTNGSLTTMAVATVATGISPQSVTVDPTGKYVYVTDAGSNAVSQYTIGADGSLAPNVPGTAAAGPTPVAMAMSSGASPVAAIVAGSNVYVANNGPGVVGGSGVPTTVSEYAISTNGGLALTDTAAPFAGASSPFVGTSGGAAAVATDPSSRYAYVATNSWVSQYTIGQNGTLTSMAVPYLTPATCYVCTAIAVHPSGSYLYVVDSSYSGLNTVPTIPNMIYQFRIGADGSLMPFPSPSDSFAIDAGRPASIAIDPSGRYAYVVFQVNDPNSGALYGVISRYAIDANGSLMDVAQAGASRTGKTPTSIVIDPTGRFAYVANASTNDVSAYVIDSATGALTGIDCGTGAGCDPNNGGADFVAGLHPYGVAVDPTGKYVYVANFGDAQDQTTPGTVSQFSIGPNGTLTPMATATVTAGVHPRAIIADPTGQFVYVANEGDLVNSSPGTVSQFSIGADGALAPMALATIPAGRLPVAITATATYQ